jgi:hypothetical protein
MSEEKEGFVELTNEIISTDPSLLKLLRKLLPDSVQVRQTNSFLLCIRSTRRTLCLIFKIPVHQPDKFEDS